MQKQTKNNKYLLEFQNYCLPCNLLEDASWVLGDWGGMWLFRYFYCLIEQLIGL